MIRSAVQKNAVAGQGAPQAVFEVMARAGALDEAQASMRTHYAEALAAYRARRFDAARAGFNAALEAVPGDGPSRTMLGRIAQFEARAPEEAWDGAWRLDSK